jgi:RNA polymerase sigma-70 factor (ECF subfamily)
MMPSDRNAVDRHVAVLIGRVAAGDRAAMKLLYTETSMKLIGITMRIVGDRQDAEDVVQECYVTVWRKAAEYDPERAGPWAWLVTIARNRAIDRVRARRVRPTTPVADAYPLPDPHARTDALADANDMARQVDGALAGLDPRHAAVIRGAYLDGLSYDELSAREGVPVGTIKTWVFRGLRRMRGALGEEAAP